MNPIRVLLLSLLLLALYACRPQPDRAADRPAPPKVSRANPVAPKANPEEGVEPIEMNAVEPIVEVTPGPAWFDSVWHYYPTRKIGQIHLSGQNGLLRSDGSVLAATKYRYIVASSHGFYQMTDPFSYAQPSPLPWEVRWGIMDNSGTELLSPKYSLWPRPLGEGLFAVFVNGRLRVLNLKGQDAFVVHFDEIEEFSSGLAAVKTGCPKGSKSYGCNGGKWGFIDLRGKTVLPLKFDSVHAFRNGLAWVRYGCKNTTGEGETSCDGGLWELIDSSGKNQLPMKITNLEVLERPRHEYDWKRRNERYAEATFMKVTVDANSPGADGVKELHGVVDERGKIVIPLSSCMEITRAFDYLMIHSDTDNWTVHDLQGTLLREFQSEPDAYDWVTRQMGPEVAHPNSQNDARNPYQWEPWCMGQYPETVASPVGGRCARFVHRNKRVYCEDQGLHHRPLPGVTRVLDFNGPWAPFEKAGRWGFLDSDARVVHLATLDFQFVSHQQCGFRLDRDLDANPLFFFKERSRQASVDAGGNRLPWTTLPDTNSNSEHLVPWNFPTNEKADWMRSHPRELPDFAPPMPFASWGDSSLRVEKGPRGFVVKDETGRTVFVGAYEKLTPVRDGEFFIVANGCSSQARKGCTKTGLVDRSGKVRVPLVYDEVLPEDAVVTEDCDEGSDFSSGKIRVKRGEFLGVFDWNSGREIIAPRRYSAICAFEGKVARVRVNKGKSALGEQEDSAFYSVGLWGLVSDTDQELVPPVHGAIEPFSGGVARFRVHAPCTTRGHAPCAHGRVGLLDAAGRVVLAPEYDAISPKLADGTRRVLQTGRMGLLRVRRR